MAGIVLRMISASSTKERFRIYSKSASRRAAMDSTVGAGPDESELPSRRKLKERVVSVSHLNTKTAPHNKTTVAPEIRNGLVVKTFFLGEFGDWLAGHREVVSFNLYW